MSIEFVPFETFSVNGTFLAARCAGQGEPAFIFLHYYGGSSRTWHLVMQDVAEYHRCIAPDLRGWGYSDVPEAGYSVTDMAEDIAQLTERLGVTRGVMVGHSMGGKVALALAACRPEWLTALVLIAPSPPTPEPMSDTDRALLMAGYGKLEVAKQTLNSITVQRLPLREQELVWEDSLRCSQVAWQSWLEHGSREDISSIVAHINVPTYVLAGAADPVLSTALLEQEVAGRIPGASLTVVPDAGHLLPLEAPRALSSFLNALKL